jgi:hypothetical protein
MLKTGTHVVRIRKSHISGDKVGDQAMVVGREPGYLDDTVFSYRVRLLTGVRAGREGTWFPEYTEEFIPKILWEV